MPLTKSLRKERSPVRLPPGFVGSYGSSLSEV